MKTFLLFGGQFGYVDRYYHNGKWVDVKPWHEIEEDGKPPVIVIANGESNGGKLSYSGDCRTHGFYDWVNFLVGYCDEDKVTFPDLERAAKAIGWGSAFDRRMLEGNHLRKTLVTNASLFPIPEHFTFDVGAFEARLLKAGCENVMPIGDGHILFDC